MSIYFRVFACFIIYLGVSGCKQTPSDHTPAVSAAEYVGDEACESCHEDLYASYKRTGMGRSVSLFKARSAPETATPAPVFDAKRNLYYEIIIRNDSLYQREYRKDDAGQVVHERIHRADYVVGSGNATRSYMMNTKGYLTEMPLTWYVRKAKWDLSPGYTQNNDRFERPINLECMTCHNGFSPNTENTQNHYPKVALGIGCERCHGPGGKHVEARLAGGGTPKGQQDPTIVNSKYLDREKQLSVCQQCHVDGTAVFKEGHSPLTFRPGMALAAHRSIFVPDEQLNDPQKFGIASHGARLAQSACYQKSQMTCTTCHDPHRPVQELGADAFNQQCMTCHTTGAKASLLCSRTEAAAVPSKAMTGNCVSCHLQKSGTSDIPHVTFTDHWIRKTLPAARAASGTKELETAKQRPSPFTLAKVIDAETTSTALGNEAQAKLEAAIAYFKFYEVTHQHPNYLPMVVRYAQEGFAAGGQSFEARLVWGRALLDLKKTAEAVATLQQASEEKPQDALALYWLGQAYERQKQANQALEAYRKAAGLQPKFIEAQLRYATALSATGEANQAIAVLQTAVRENPVHYPSAWNNLGMLYLQSQRLDEAISAFKQAVRLDPDLIEALVNLASAYLMQQRFPQAQPLLETAIRLDAQNIAAYGNLGYLYLQQGQTAKAKQMFKKVLELSPNDPQAQQYLQQL